MNEPHLPVLLQEVLDAFRGQHLSCYVDGTLGAGGHAEAMLQDHPEIESFVGIDQDPSARELATKRLEPFKEKTAIVAGNFRVLEEILSDLKISSVNGILLDLGVSSMQLDRAERGFSFMREGPLDMRMNPDQELTAATICNEWPEEKLLRIMWDYGEEPKARQAVRAILKGRPFFTTQELVDCLTPALRWKGGSRTNPVTRVFQALRIAVNSELDVVREVLPQAIDALAVGGRLAVITFHSLEDRIVKRWFQEAASDKQSTSGVGGLFLDKEPTVKLVTRKPLIATEEEQKMNSRSRSAKLRVIEKL